MEEKLCSIEDFEKNKDAFEKQKPPFNSQWLYRIKVEQIPNCSKNFTVERAYKQKNPKQLEWRYHHTYTNIKEAQKIIDTLIEEEKITSGYYVEAYINYPEKQ